MANRKNDILQGTLALLVLKTRASDHHPEIREFKIRPEGIVLGEKFNADQQFD